jgi:hypothetical protein
MLTPLLLPASRNAGGHAVNGDKTNSEIFWCADLFTPEAIRVLLQEKVLRATAKLPTLTHPQLVALSSRLFALHFSVWGWKGRFRAAEEQSKAIREAIRVLTEILPPHRGHYDVRVQVFAHEASRGRITEEMAAEARADLAAVDALVSAARIACERGVPMDFYRAPVGPRIER